MRALTINWAIAVQSAATKLEELRPILEKIGIAAELVSPEHVGVQAFPSFLFERGVDPGEFIAELFERADAEWFAAAPPTSEQALSEVLDMMACKAAVKQGDRMSDTELGDLLKLREMVERSCSCPRGRPSPPHRPRRFLTEGRRSLTGAVGS